MTNEWYEVDDSDRRFQEDVAEARRYEPRVDEIVLGLRFLAERNPQELNVSEGGRGEILAKIGFHFRIRIDEQARRVRFLRMKYIGPAL